MATSNRIWRMTFEQRTTIDELTQDVERWSTFATLSGDIVLLMWDGKRAYEIEADGKHIEIATKKL